MNTTTLQRVAFCCIACFVGLLPQPTARAMNLVRAETRVDDALARYGVTGSNVVVAILDRGIDWQHPDFQNDDGTSRVEWFFDLLDNSGAHAPGNPYGRGTLYSKAQLDAALQGGTSLAARDAVGHGTTTSGIACGNGRANPLYRGIAPGARIITVKITSDGAPAHGNQPAEAAFYDSALLPVAIDFVKEKVAALGLPCVMLLNVGSVGGPTDGTSSLCRKIDSVVGPGKPGLAFVTGASDDGGAPNRASGTVGAGETVSLQIAKATAGTLTFDLWYPETDRFEVQLQTPNGTWGPFATPASAGASAFQQQADFVFYHLGANVDFSGSSAPKREIWVRFTGPAGNYTVQLKGTSVSSGRFDATLNPSRFDATGAPVNRFLNFLAPGSIWDGASASNNICPNSYVIRTNYTDIDHIKRRVSGEGPIGGLWTSSGVGPTFDGRLGMDVSAPGDSVFTTYNPNSYWATFRFNLAEGGNTNYGRASAVSAASPTVTGIIALMLEMDPTLDAASIKRILHESARADAFTGVTPNPDWGYGKVDALGALDRVHAELTRLSVLQTDQNIRLSARGQSQQTYVFESSTDFLTWQPVATNTASSTPMELVVSPAANAQFFRLARRVTH